MDPRAGPIAGGSVVGFLRWVRLAHMLLIRAGLAPRQVEGRRIARRKVAPILLQRPHWGAAQEARGWRGRCGKTMYGVYTVYGGTIGGNSETQKLGLL